jgi:hypothetical protein
MINRRRFFIGGSMALASAITLSRLRPLLASSDRLPADLLISARKRNRFSVPTDDQFMKADVSTRNSGSLQDLRADFDVDSAPDFAQNFIIGVDDKLISAVPIVDRNRKNQGSVHVSVLDRVSHQEVESIGWVIRPQGQNYRAIVKKDRKRFMDILLTPMATLLKDI